MNFDRPPVGVGIKLIESSEQQVVISIPAGGARCRFVGCFGLSLLLVVVSVSMVFLLVPGNAWEGSQPFLKIMLLAFFSLFYIIGFGLLYAWLRMRFTKVLIAVTVDQFALQRTWFHRQKLETLELDESSLAELVESYKQNNTPVYSIRIRSANELEKEPKFATRLSFAEKRWLAGVINNFLSNSYGHLSSDHSYNCTRCGSQLPQGHGKINCEQCGEEHMVDNPAMSPQPNTEGDLRQRLEDPRGQNVSIVERPPSIAPDKLPRESSIRIDLNDNDTLAFSYRIKIPHPIAYIITIFLSVFCTLWYGIGTVVLASFLFAGNDGHKIFALIPALLLIIGLLPLSILVFLLRGRVRMRIDREGLSGSIGALLLHKTASISNHSIQDVGIGHLLYARSGEVPKPMFSNKIASCVVKSSERNMALTWSSDSSLNHQVAGLVRNHLEHIGINLNTD